MPIEIAYEIYKEFDVYLFDLELIEATSKRRPVTPAKSSISLLGKTLMRKCIRWRQGLVSSYESFIRETHSTLREKWVTGRSNAFLSAATCFAISNFMWSPELVDGISNGNTERVLLISLGVLVVTVPFEIVDYVRFFRWRRKAFVWN